MRIFKDSKYLQFLMFFSILYCASAFDCPSPNGTFAHPTDCRRYYVCSQNNDTKETCPEGEAFNTTLEACDIETECSANDTKSSFECPEDGKFKDPDDKRAYYECKGGEAAHVSCPKNSSVFDESKKECVSEKELETRSLNSVVILSLCVSDQRFVDPDNINAYFECKNGKLNHLTCPQGQIFDHGKLSCILPKARYNDFVCPGKGAFPNLNDCTTFYTCANKGHLGQKGFCKPPSVFNIELGFCDFRSGVKCHHAFPCFSDGIFPDPEDCASYFLCSKGTATIKFCSEGLLFNEDTLSCDWPHKTKCAEGFRCTNDGNFADPNDCTKFYQCIDLTSALKDCPKGLYFNPSIGMCDFPSNVMCSKAYAVPCGRNGIFPDPTDCRKYFECIDGRVTEKICARGLLFNDVTKSCDWAYSVRCIKGFRCSVDGIFADPQDCNAFLVCKNGALQRVPCPEGLHFNKELETCDLTDNAKCIPETTCLEDGIFANPLNCSTFFKCVGGIRVFKACSDGLLFNPDKGICDWPSSVTCAGSNPPYWYESKKEEKQVTYSETEYPLESKEPEYYEETTCDN